MIETLDQMIRKKFGYLSRPKKTRFKARHPNLIKFRNRMRDNPTDAEIKLKGLLHLAFPKHEIKTQVILKSGGIANYIVDFYISKFQLVFEADGKQHEKTAIYDQERDRRINDLGLFVVRIPNHAIYSEGERLLKILKKIRISCSKHERLDKFKGIINNAFGWRSGQRRMSESIERKELIPPSDSATLQIKRRPSADIGTRPYVISPA